MIYMDPSKKSQRSDLEMNGDAYWYVIRKRVVRESPQTQCIVVSTTFGLKIMNMKLLKYLKSKR